MWDKDKESKEAKEGYARAAWEKVKSGAAAVADFTVRETVGTPEHRQRLLNAGISAALFAVGAKVADPIPAFTETGKLAEVSAKLGYETVAGDPPGWF